jgi:diphosphomevalonate decarboxylase
VPAATARACANIALVKYWGKRDAQLNLPATGSLSLTLDALSTATTVAFDAALDRDAVELDGGAADGASRARVIELLDLVRARAGLAARARVTSRNDFPTASGLASSASGFAALALAATRAAGVTLEPRELSRLARRGSGSAARSVFGGFVRMHAGARDEDAFAEPVSSPLLANVRMVVAIFGGGIAKEVGSRDAMEHCAATSPLYPSWLALVPDDLAAAERALAAGDLTALGEVTEANALAMHATAIAARPAIVYWQPATLALLARVRGLRKAGVAAWATMDAGPHVKVLTTVEHADTVAHAVVTVAGFTEALVSAPGGPAEVIA